MAATRFEGYTMSDSTPTFTPEDKTFLATIRDNIAARPDFYRAGIDYLHRRYSVDTLHAADLKTWEELRKINSAVEEPDRDGSSYWPCQRLIRAFGELLRDGLDTPDDDPKPYDPEKAKAVLCLTWLLTDKNANKHPLGEAFGPWLAGQHEYAELPYNDEFALQVAAKGRAMARIATLDELNGQYRSRWMELTRLASDALADELKEHVDLQDARALKATQDSASNFTPAAVLSLIQEVKDQSAALQSRLDDVATLSLPPQAKAQGRALTAEEDAAWYAAAKRLGSPVWDDRKLNDPAPDLAYLDAVFAAFCSRFGDSARDVGEAYGRLAPAAAYYGHDPASFTKAWQVADLTAAGTLKGNLNDGANGYLHAMKIWTAFLRGAPFPDDALLRLEADMLRRVHAAEAAAVLPAKRDGTDLPAPTGRQAAIRRFLDALDDLDLFQERNTPKGPVMAFVGNAADAMAHVQISQMLYEQHNDLADAVRAALPPVLALATQHKVAPGILTIIDPTRASERKEARQKAMEVLDRLGAPSGTADAKGVTGSETSTDLPTATQSVDADPIEATASKAEPAKPTPPAPPMEGNWLIPTTLADMANRLGNVGTKKLRTMLLPYQLRQHGENRQLWTVRLDDMPTNIREKLERGR